MEKKEFCAVFMMNRMIAFEIRYSTVGSNSHPYFATTACKFCRNKSDWEECGQAQERLLSGYSKTFWGKWDKFHLKDLTENEYLELITDLNKLKCYYPYFIIKYENKKISFNEIKTLSMEVK